MTTTRSWEELESSGYTDAEMRVFRSAAGASRGLFVIVGLCNSGKSTSVDALAEVLTTRGNSVAVLDELSSAEAAANACAHVLRGQLVIADLHAPSVAAVPARLNALGISRATLAAPGFLVGAVAQRLVPILCSRCKLSRLAARRVPAGLNEVAEVHELLHATLPDSALPQVRYARARGCRRCHAGVSGRRLIAEGARFDADALDGIRKGWPEAKLQTQMIASGMQPLAAAALRLIGAGDLDPCHVDARLDLGVWESLTSAAGHA